MCYSEVCLTKATKKLWEQKASSAEFDEQDPELKRDLFQQNSIYSLIRTTASQYHENYQVPA